MPTIEDIILANDGRGISALRPHLAPNYCEEAAACLMANPGTVLIATGFYIMAAGAPETDGPPGALALGRALEALGRDVFYVADRYTCPIMEPFASDPSQIVDFPITDDETSRSFAEDLLGDLDPSVVIAIERCSITREGTYLNMRGMDITAQTARLDHLFHGHPNTVGIGDGGNEIGMGNLADVIPGVSLPAPHSLGDGDYAPDHLQRVQLGRVRRGGGPVQPGRQEPAPRSRRGRRADPDDGGHGGRRWRGGEGHLLGGRHGLGPAWRGPHGAARAYSRTVGPETGLYQVAHYGRQGLVDARDHVFHFAPADAQGRHDAHVVAAPQVQVVLGELAGEALCQPGFLGEVLLGLPVLHDLHPAHQAKTAHIPHDWVLGLQLFQPRPAGTDPWLPS